jgi:CheY-like chemotaxis protein
MLREHGYEVTTAADGESAWKYLKSGTYFDVTLLDLGLPDIDGITLLQRIMADPELNSVPVIVASYRDDNESVSKTLEAGAQYFLAKPLQASYLLAVLRMAIERRDEFKTVKKSLNDAAQYVGLLKSGTFQYRTVAQACGLARGLAQACAEPARSWQGLQELLINAVEHGNFGISYAEKSLLMLENRWQEEIERRTQDPNYSSLQVTVHLVRAPDGLILTIQDQGKGFVWQPFLDFSPERMFDLHGRGIAIGMTSFDSMEYLGNGNTVRIKTASTPIDSKWVGIVG